MLFELHNRHLAHAVLHKNIVIILLFKKHCMGKERKCVLLKEIDKLIGNSNIKDNVISFVRYRNFECVI